jgi:hypothetical protein
MITKQNFSRVFFRIKISFFNIFILNYDTIGFFTCQGKNTSIWQKYSEAISKPVILKLPQE